MESINDSIVIRECGSSLTNDGEYIEMMLRPRNCLQLREEEKKCRYKNKEQRSWKIVGLNIDKQSVDKGGWVGNTHLTVLCYLHCIFQCTRQ